MSRITFFLLLVLAALSGCVQQREIRLPAAPVQIGPDFGLMQTQTVQFQVQPSNPPIVEIASPPNMNCTNPKIPPAARKGCIVVEPLNQASITMEVLSPANWYFDRIEICPGEKKRKDTGEHCRMKPDQIAIFPVVYKDASGKNVAGVLNADGVFAFPAALELRSFVLIDKNPVAEFYFYRVRLCKGKECAWIDPPIENKGIGTGA